MSGPAFSPEEAAPNLPDILEVYLRLKPELKSACVKAGTGVLVLKTQIFPNYQ